jgi:hypothetical protein
VDGESPCSWDTALCCHSYMMCSESRQPCHTIWRRNPPNGSMEVVPTCYCALKTRIATSWYSICEVPGCNAST